MALRRRERAQSSLRFNGIYYFVYMLIAIPIVVALAFRLNSFDIYVLKVRTQAASLTQTIAVSELPAAALCQAFGQAFSNAFGLFLCMIFLGYGLVEVPRNLWRKANYADYLRQCEGLAGTTKANLDKKRDELDEAIADLRLFEPLIQEVSQSRAERSEAAVAQELHAELYQVKSLLTLAGEGAAAGAAEESETEPLGTPQPSAATPARSLRKRKPKSKYDSIEVRTGVEDVDDEALHEAIVKIHKRVREGLVNFHKARCKWTQLVDDALEMEDNKRHMEPRREPRDWKWESNLLVPLEFVWIDAARSRALFMWRVFIQPPLLKVAAVLGAVLSVITLVSAASTMPYAISLSMCTESQCAAWHFSPAHLLIGIPDRAMVRNLLRFICISYYSLCCIYSLFRLKIASVYELYKGATDEYTITLNTMLLMRLVPPMLWFFYGAPPSACAAGFCAHV